jgi:vitamin B12 transporter
MLSRRSCRRQRAGVVFAPFVSLVVASPVIAQSPQEVLPPVVVTATRSAQSFADALADLTVIGPEEIARAGPGGLAELLQRQPGIEIARNGGPGGVTSLFLRGSNRGHTIVLIDGVRVGSATAGAASLEAIPLDAIERIEILRGPASGLYGADAIGGVVQVFTKSAPEGGVRGSARAGYGTYDTREIGGSLGASTGPLRFNVQAAHRESNGFNAIDDPANFSYNPDRDGYSGDSGSADATLTWAKGQELAGGVFRSRLNAQFDAGPDHDDRTITVVESARIESRNRLHELWTSRLLVAQSVDDSLSRTGFGDAPFRTRDRQYTWLNDIALPVGSMTAGFERREERVDSDTAFTQNERDTNALLAVYQWRDDVQALAANLRQDHSDQFGSRTSGGATYAYRVLPSLRLSAGFATAFKAPTFNDLYFPGFSNPSLKPETSRNVEAGALYTGNAMLAGAPAAFEARATGYYNRVRDLIVFQCDANFVCAPQNVSDATLEGVTLALDMRRGDTAVKASVDLANPHDDDSGHLLPRRARQHSSVGVSQGWGAWRFGAEWIASSHRFDDAENTVRLAGYGLLNLTAEWTFMRGWSVLVRGDNVFDRDYRLAAGYATGGAMAFAALRWQP